MRWNALVFGLIAPVVVGCAKPTAKVDTNIQVPETAPEPESFAVDPASSAAMPEAGSSTSTYTPPGSGGGSRTVVATAEGPGAGGTTTHRVARGDTLYSLARKYYNDPKRWTTIYDANRDKIASPKALPVGKTLVIP